MFEIYIGTKRPPLTSREDAPANRCNGPATLALFTGQARPAARGLLAKLLLAPSCGAGALPEPKLNPCCCGGAALAPKLNPPLAAAGAAALFALFAPNPNEGFAGPLELVPNESQSGRLGIIIGSK